MNCINKMGKDNNYIFKEGQEVAYNGKQTHIEEIFDDATCNIANPDWDWDEECECVKLGLEYDIPYWLTVNLSDLLLAD